MAARPGDVGQKIARKHLDELIEKYKGICQFCYTKIPPGQETREHIKRLADGGSGGRDNITLCCMPCNNARATAENTREQIRTWINECLDRQARGLSLIRKRAFRPTRMSDTWPVQIEKGIQGAIARQRRGRPIVAGVNVYVTECSDIETRRTINARS